MAASLVLSTLLRCVIDGYFALNQLWPCDPEDALEVINTANAAAGNTLRAVLKASTANLCENPSPLYVMVRVLIGEEYMEDAAKRTALRGDEIQRIGSAVIAGRVGIPSFGHTIPTKAVAKYRAIRRDTGTDVSERV